MKGAPWLLKAVVKTWHALLPLLPGKPEAGSWLEIKDGKCKCSVCPSYNAKPKLSNLKRHSRRWVAKRKGFIFFYGSKIICWG
jgi:hypothetical protein